MCLLPNTVPDRREGYRTEKDRKTEKGEDMNIAYVDWSLDVECPNCKENVELSKQDDENSIARKLFSNQWDKIVGWEATCPYCKHEFIVDKVDY